MPTVQVLTGGEQIWVWENKKRKTPFWDCNPRQGPSRLLGAGVGAAQPLFRLVLSFGVLPCPQ